MAQALRRSRGSMPALADNLSMWNQAYDWSQRGDEWSEAWGGVSYQWWVTLFPRIQAFVPAARILEIAPGYGRWTNFLRELCDELIAVDIAENAVAHCRERFAGDERVSFHVNDGTSLAVAADRSVGLVFSFDSLVHAERDVIGGYLREFARVLADDGVAFIHHSNTGAYEPGTYDPHNIHWRATTVSAELVERLARAEGLSCVSQETVAWGNETILNDCFSVITRAGSRWDRENEVAANLDFARRETAVSRGIAALYPPAPPTLAYRAEERDQTTHTHTAALEIAAEGDAASARAVLRDAVRRQLDPETLNDLAVLAHHCGDDEEAVALLDALVRLHPEHGAARENLAELCDAG
jgi:SAM-dependent methyltransferase